MGLYLLKHLVYGMIIIEIIIRVSPTLLILVFGNTKKLSFQ